jgi:hypothetical protein
MLIWVTDTNNKAKVAVNTEHLVVVFIAQEGEQQGKTVLGLTGGINVIVEETDLEIVGMVNAG